MLSLATLLQINYCPVRYQGGEASDMKRVDVTMTVAVLTLAIGLAVPSPSHAIRMDGGGVETHYQCATSSVTVEGMTVWYKTC